MGELNKKRKIALVLTIVTLANLWASIACQVPNTIARGSFTMVTIVLVGITIERWAKFLKLYIDNELDKKINNQ